MVRIHQQQLAAPLGDAQHLAQRSFRILEMLEHAFGPDRVERLVGKRQLVGATDAQVDRAAGVRRRGLRRVDHRGRQIDAGNPTLGADLSGDLDADLAGAAANVEERGATPQLEQLVAFAPKIAEAARQKCDVVDQFG